MSKPLDLSLSDRATVRGRTSNQTVHGIFDFLTDAAERSGWRLVYYKAAHSAVQFHWGEGRESYRHSFIVNVGDLLFYLRPPALRTHPLWSDISLLVFGHQFVSVNANARGETTVRLTNQRHAQLAETLFLRSLIAPE